MFKPQRSSCRFFGRDFRSNLLQIVMAHSGQNPLGERDEEVDRSADARNAEAGLVPGQLSKEELETFRMQLKAMSLVAQVGDWFRRFSNFEG